MSDLIDRQDAIRNIRLMDVCVMYDDMCSTEEAVEKAIVATKRTAIFGLECMPSAEPDRASCKQVTGKLDLINRQDAIDAVNAYLGLSAVSRTIQNMTSIQEILEKLPSAQPKYLVKESGDLVKDLVNDCISRQEAIDVIMSEPPDAHYPSWYADILWKLPSSEPRKKGKWIQIEAGYFDYVKCSLCGEPLDWKMNFCPNCGADMTGGEEE